MYFKSNEIKHCYTSFIIWLSVEIDHATEHHWQKFQSWDMLSPMMKFSDINSQDG